MTVYGELYHFNPNHDSLGRFATKTAAGIYYRTTQLKPSYRSYQKQLKRNLRDSGVRQGRSYDIIKKAPK